MPVERKERSNSGQRETLNFDAVSAETSQPSGDFSRGNDPSELPQVGLRRTSFHSPTSIRHWMKVISGSSWGLGLSEVKAIP